jgi:hypothetical protein
VNASAPLVSDALWLFIELLLPSAMTHDEARRDLFAYIEGEQLAGRDEAVARRGAWAARTHV